MSLPLQCPSQVCRQEFTKHNFQMSDFCTRTIKTHAYKGSTIEIECDWHNQKLKLSEISEANESIGVFEISMSIPLGYHEFQLYDDQQAVLSMDAEGCNNLEYAIVQKDNGSLLNCLNVVMDRREIVAKFNAGAQQAEQRHLNNVEDLRIRQLHHVSEVQNNLYVQNGLQVQSEPEYQNVMEDIEMNVTSVNEPVLADSDEDGDDNTTNFPKMNLSK